MNKERSSVTCVNELMNKERSSATCVNLSVNKPSLSKAKINLIRFANKVHLDGPNRRNINTM